MKTILLKVFCCFGVFMLGSCINKKISWRVTLDRDDKKPYGSYLAFRSLEYYFPQAEIETLSQGFRYTSIDEKMKQGENSLLVLLGLDLYVSAAELESLLSFAGAGNEIVLFCSRLDEKIENEFGCYKQENGLEEMRLSNHNNGRQNLKALMLADRPERTYGYSGRSLQGYFRLKNLGVNVLDSLTTFPAAHPDTLGYMNSHPNFVRYAIGAGHITLHAAPLVMCNYFLLQENNRFYLDGIWQAVPANTRHIYWNEYFKHRAEDTDLGVLWKYAATRWALIIALATLVAYVLFESKRRQRLIPVIEKPENSSVSFVETVGRLYYNKGSHNNIAEKMIQHFLEWVRLHYYLNTNELNGHFINQLTHKSGMEEKDIKELVEMIHNIRLKNISVDETLLIELHGQLQSLYKNQSN